MKKLIYSQAVASAVTLVIFFVAMKSRCGPAVFSATLLLFCMFVLFARVLAPFGRWFSAMAKAAGAVSAATLALAMNTMPPAESYASIATLAVCGMFLSAVVIGWAAGGDSSVVRFNRGAGLFSIQFALNYGIMAASRFGVHSPTAVAPTIIAAGLAAVFFTPPAVRAIRLHRLWRKRCKLAKQENRLMQRVEWWEKTCPFLLSHPYRETPRDLYDLQDELSQVRARLSEIDIKIGSMAGSKAVARQNDVGVSHNHLQVLGMEKMSPYRPEIKNVRVNWEGIRRMMGWKGSIEDLKRQKLE